MSNIFSAADVLLPVFPPESKEWNSYAVIACDQFTGEVEYWEEAEKIASGSFSVLDYILPEAYLETKKEEVLKKKIAENMKTAKEKFKKYENSMIYVERTLPDGRIRKGIVGKIDLEKYDYSQNSKSPVRATEKTVTERIPPRVAVRREATVEFPHIMIFVDDKKKQIFSQIDNTKLEKLYDFELMLGGGRIKGWLIDGLNMEKMNSAIAEYESANAEILYAIGDGNHSLASAKSHYEQLKSLGTIENIENHPARYALAEIVDLNDENIEFEPIYRILQNCDAEKVLEMLENCDKTDDNITVITEKGSFSCSAPAGHPLTVGSLQLFCDKYMEENGGNCDYIHGVESLKTLAAEKNSVGFLFDTVAKGELFDYVSANGSLPKKTFSMGEAKSKRYYLEAREII